MRFVLLGLFISSLTACTQNPEWTLFYYADEASIPTAAKPSEHIAGYYSTSEQCLMKGAGMVKLSDSGVGSFQCGQQCVANDTGSLTCQTFVDSLIF
jgi:hypothetical protein